MTEEATINLNHSDMQISCMHTVSNFGNDIYYNICNHTQTVVPWGSADWVGNIFCLSFVGLLGFGMVAFLLFAGWSIFTD